MSIKNLLLREKITPNNSKLFYEALTHSTFSNEKADTSNYQRLEFIGDAILGKEAALKIYELYKNISEGEMSIMRSNAINSKQLAIFARKLELNNFARFGNTAEVLKNNEKILADLFESFTAAIYLDQGQKKLEQFLKNNVFEFIIKTNGKELKNPKTILQEFLQSDSRCNVSYKISKSKQGFKAIAIHEKTIYGKGYGNTKKDAEVNAAKNALEKVNIK